MTSLLVCFRPTPNLTYFVLLLAASSSSLHSPFPSGDRLLIHPVFDGLVLPQAPACIVPLALEASAGTEGRQRADGNDNHSTLRDHKGDLVIGECALEPGGQFRRSEDRPNEDGQCCNPEDTKEGLEGEAVPQRDEVRILVAGLLAIFAKSPSKLSAQYGEETKTGDLPSNACNHDVNAQLVGRVGVGSRGDGTTNSLQEQGDEIE